MTKTLSFDWLTNVAASALIAPKVWLARVALLRGRRIVAKREFNTRKTCKNDTNGSPKRFTKGIIYAW